MFPKGDRNQVAISDHIDMVTREIDVLRRDLPDGSASPLTHKHKDWNKRPPFLPKENVEKENAKGKGNEKGKGKEKAKKRKTG